ncbi:zinc-dependent alcohol dehydrogenase family protein [Segeticoccus rhizosphaerae]|uniref:zinc-dependent alcohol dehydrogenase family protein n=1 Tax=Segeticoccus rhizosphaerae TaxID=1104777 RepID=UPI0010C0E55F|nr:zinc-binding dehydrogenase [Ornithinicoccus soli]
MDAVRLPGASTVSHVRVPVPVPGQGQVLLRVGASSICGSDIRSIYREHLGRGPEAYQGVIAGHEPAGEVAALGPGVRRLAVGDRVAVYHIVGCGRCDECRHGYEIGCTDPSRAAYGWQRDGGHAQFLLAEERSCLPLPDALSLVDGALVSCGFGTAYEALLRLDVSGRDQLLVTGLGPVGLAAAMMGRAMGASPVIGTDPSAERRRLALDLGLVDRALPADEGTVDAVLDLTGGRGCSATLDASGSAAGRATALAATRTWGRCAFVGEGGRLEIDVSPVLIHPQLAVHGSWVTSLGHMAQLLEDLVRWRLRPERIVTHRFPLERADEAYAVAAAGAAGKVCLIPA